MDVLIGPPRALTSGENLYSLTVRDRYTHTLGHTLLPKKPTTLPTRVLSALARVEGAAPAAGFHLPSPSSSSRPESRASASAAANAAVKSVGHTYDRLQQADLSDLPRIVRQVCMMYRQW